MIEVENEKRFSDFLKKVRTGAGQGLEDSGVLVACGDGGDKDIVALDLGAQHVELAHEEEDELALRCDDTFVGGDRDGVGCRSVAVTLPAVASLLAGVAAAPRFP